ncbi:unnamed protein product [Microthlaspi erraticum]|uniref:Uncharacterized protein n=1 Tax=Microthlaspi erraticum TaxID=1685480 RepID=A0A6D2JRW2_9BRAS|nr:unnamed protein product [Microthlaspi erraticum]
MVRGQIREQRSGQLSCGGTHNADPHELGITLEKPVDPQAINIQYLRKSTYLAGQEEEDYAHPGAAGEGESSGDVENLMDYKTGEFHFKNHEIKGRKSAANTALETHPRSTATPDSSLYSIHDSDNGDNVLSPIPKKVMKAPPNSKRQRPQPGRGRPRSHLKRAQRMIPHHPPPQILSERYEPQPCK